MLIDNGGRGYIWTVAAELDNWGLEIEKRNLRETYKVNEFKLKKKIDKRCFVLICIISFFLLFGKFIYEKTIMPVSQDVAINTMIGKGESRLSVSSLDIIEQKFIAQEDIQGIILFFGKEKELLNEGNIGIEIID